MLITTDQIRAARALKNWSQTDLAERTGLAVPTIANIELGKQDPGKNTVAKIINAFEAAGIEFIGERGVQKKEQKTQVFRGQQQFKQFYDVIYETLKENNEDVLVGGVDEREFVRSLDEETLIIHVARMKEVNAHYKILVCEDDYFFPVSVYSEYRWMKKEEFSSVPFYVFANKLAIILWLDEPLAFLIDDAAAANVYREKFMAQWKTSKKPPKSPEAITSFEPKDKDKVLKNLKKKGRK